MKYCFLLQLVSATPLLISANHISLDKPLGENITLSMSATMLPAGCRVTVSINDAHYK